MKEFEMGGACSIHGEVRNVYKILVGKTESRRPVRRPRRRGENDIEIHLK
jgi:hypothetical protein